MIKKILIAVIAFVFVLNVQAQVGKVFPDLKGLDLNEKEISIPTACKGKSTIICIAYSKKAEEALHNWLVPIYAKYVAKTGLMDGVNDANVFFIPMFTGIHEPTENMAKKQLKEGTDKKFFANVICYRGSIHPYKEVLNFDEKEIPYFFILDKDGKIVYTTKGLYSDKKMEEIDDKIE